MKNTSNSLITVNNGKQCINNTLLNDKQDDKKSLLHTVVESEQEKNCKRRIQQGLKEYPEMLEIVDENKHLIEELNTSADLGEQFEAKVSEVKELRLKLAELSKSSLAQRVDQLEQQLTADQNQISHLKSTITQVKELYEAKINKKDQEYKTLYDAYSACQSENNALKEHINNSKGLLQSWNKDSYIRELEDQIVSLKQKYKSGGRKPIPQEQQDKIKELKSFGLTNYGVAKTLRLSPATVAKYL